MKSRQRTVALVLVVLLAAALFALLRTRTSPPVLSPTVTSPSEPIAIDQRPLPTAQQFAKMPTVEDEKPFAQQALELADQEMDLAFAAAVLDAQQHPPVLTPQA